MNLRTGLQMACLGLLGVLAGCIPSLHPLYTEADLTFDPALVGVWASEGSKDTWTVTRAGEKAYHVVLSGEEGKKGEFVLHLLKVQDRMFVDLFPVEPDLKENNLYKMSVVRVHRFFRVRQIQPTLQLAVLKPDWMETFLREHPEALRHETVDGSILLTAQPKELQAFLLKQDTNAEAWGECAPMTRRAEPPKP